MKNNYYHGLQNPKLLPSILESAVTENNFDLVTAPSVESFDFAEDKSLKGINGPYVQKLKETYEQSLNKIEIYLPSIVLPILWEKTFLLYSFTCVLFNRISSIKEFAAVIFAAQGGSGIDNGKFFFGGGVCPKAVHIVVENDGQIFVVPVGSADLAAVLV